MTKYVAVPDVSGVNLFFRPRSYFWPLPFEKHLLARITGKERRKLLRERLATGHALPPDMCASTLDDEIRDALGRIHPAFMGGEYLPPFAEYEIEIARISLASTTADQISVRAQRLSTAIAYRIVDEYENGYIEYRCVPSETSQPLTLAELVAMIDGACDGGGAAISHLAANFALGVPASDLRDFVEVSSGFYLQLTTYYAARVGAWFEANTQDVCDDE